MKATSRASLILGVAALAALPAVQAEQKLWQQCGGITWHGDNTCVDGAYCHEYNDLFSQCLPGSGSSSSTPTSSAAPSAPTASAITAEWGVAIAKAKKAVAKLTLQEKVELASGVGWMKGHCVGNTYSVEKIGFPGYCLQDAPLGVRFADKVSVFPAGVNTAATFNRDLIKKRGVALGKEFRGKGVHIALGPAMNMARAAAAGRNWEGFGADPFLSGEAAYETITGMQSQGVQACAKHYLNNEQENYRDRSSSNVDDRTQHEIYLHTFLKSVQAGVSSFMCSYNLVNNTYACDNDKMLNGLLKTELGFPGFVLTDWWAKISGPTAANRGLDMVMPGEEGYGQWDTAYFGRNLVAAVNDGSVPKSRVDDMAVRILAGWYLLRQDSGYPVTNFDSWDSTDPFNKHIDVQGDHKKLIRSIGAASTVLLKNKNGALPLKKPSTIAVIGDDAGPSSKGPNGYTDRAGTDGILAIGWGSGTAEFPYLIDPLAAIKSKAATIGSTVTSALSNTDLEAAKKAATGKSVALVFIYSNSGENYLTVEGNAGDRNELKAWHGGDELVSAVASVNKNTVVVVHTVGPIIMESWIDHPNITAVVWAGLQGQEAGNSLIDILWGAVNPSGRLPYTIAKSPSDYSTQVLYTSTETVPQIDYSEGLYIDYRHFDKKNITPRFEFGFGLSYTKFTYSSLWIKGPALSLGSAPTGLGSSLSGWLHDDWVSVSFNVKNSGSVAGTEISQLYISPPASANSPPSQLRGFDDVSLKAGESKQVTIKLSRYSFSIWNTVQQKWTIPSGTHGIWVGASSRDKRLVGSIKL